MHGREPDDRRDRSGWREELEGRHQHPPRSRDTLPRVQTRTGAAALLAAAGVLAQICYPLTSGAARDDLTVAAVALFAAACTVHAVASRGAAWAAAMVLVTTGGGLAVELVGTATGFPFGEYAYAAGRLGPELAGVPLLIGPAWTMGAYPAWCAATAVVGPARRRAVVPLAACGLAGWDLYLDPQMVADGRWTWAHPQPALPGVHAVPLTNYLGWLLVALVMAAGIAAAQRLTTRSGVPSDALPRALFCWTWLGSALAHAVFLGLPVSAGYGFVGMGVLGVALLWRLRSERRRLEEVRQRCPVLRPPVSTRPNRAGLAR